MRALLTISGALCVVATTARADVTVACKEAPPDAKISMTFKPEVSIYDLTLWLRGFTCKNVIIAPDVAKHAMKLTVSAPRPLAPRQAMQLFVDAIQSAGLVVDHKPNTIVIKLGPGLPKNCPGTSSPPASGGELGGNPFSSSSDELAAGIQRLDERTYQIRRKLVTDHQEAFLKGARIVPAIKDGKPAGLKLYAIRPSSPYALLGLANGDTITSINGVQLTSAEQALEVYTKVKTAPKLEVGLIRRGQPKTLTYVIK